MSCFFHSCKSNIFMPYAHVHEFGSKSLTIRGFEKFREIRRIWIVAEFKDLDPTFPMVLFLWVLFLQGKEGPSNRPATMFDSLCKISKFVDIIIAILSLQSKKSY